MQRGPVPVYSELSADATAGLSSISYLKLQGRASNIGTEAYNGWALKQVSGVRRCLDLSVDIQYLEKI